MLLMARRLGQISRCVGNTLPHAHLRARRGYRVVLRDVVMVHNGQREDAARVQFQLRTVHTPVGPVEAQKCMAPCGQTEQGRPEDTEQNGAVPHGKVHQKPSPQGRPEWCATPLPQIQRLRWRSFTMLTAV